MTEQNAIYKLNNIQHFYGQKKVLDIRSFDIKKGSIVGISGPNGSGKSTLLKLLAFAQKPTRGQILYNGKQEYPFSPTIRSKVTLLTQKPYLLKRTVFENIAYGLQIRKDKKDLEKRISSALSAVGLDFKYFAHRMWHELSGGESQRVALAARLILKPEILLLDEPVASVDVESAQLIREASLKARNDWDATLVIVSHDISWLFSVSDRQISLLKGKLFYTGIENIIPGPFEPATHQITKQLRDGQCIRLKTPDGEQKTAVIKKNKTFLFLQKQQDTPTLNQLEGHIVSMQFEKKHTRVIVRVLVSDLNFDLSFTPDQISQLNLFPGKEVILSFKPEDAEWI